MEVTSPLKSRLNTSCCSVALETYFRALCGEPRAPGRISKGLHSRGGTKGSHRAVTGQVAAIDAVTAEARKQSQQRQPQQERQDNRASAQTMRSGVALRMSRRHRMATGEGNKAPGTAHIGATQWLQSA